ncbi:ABC transporter permease, partial [Escherichia coli]|nr:ABC transporter permease [Escherichia coli]
FQFGEREAVLLLMLLLPLAASLSALMMAVAIGCKTVKEAQASNAVLILAVSLLPLASLFNEGSEARWQLAVPALAQHVLMNRVLRGEALGPLDLLLPLAVSAGLTLAALAWLAARLRRA